MIRFYLKISLKFLRLFLQDRFWVVHIQHACTVKVQFLVKFPVDHIIIITITITIIITIIIIIVIVIIIIIYSLEFFASANADGFSLEFERQQVSSSLQDSSQYSGRSQ